MNCALCGRFFNLADLDEAVCPFCRVDLGLDQEPNKIIGDTLSLQLRWPQGELAVRVGEAEGYLSAQLMKAALESGGIPVLLQGETSVQSLGIWVGGLGAIQILVPENSVSRAQEIIAITDK